MVRRVVITGIGLVTPLGIGREVSFDSLIKGTSGIGKVTRFDTNNFKTKIAGEVKGFRPENYIQIKEIKKMGTFIHYAIAAGKEAMEDSSINVTEEISTRFGAITGVGLGGLGEIEEAKLKLNETGKLSPFFIPMIIGNLAPGNLAIMFNLKGANLNIATACASGTHAIGEAYRYIKNGYLDYALTGGAESAIAPLAFGGFGAMKALSERNDEPERASRPFDKNRDGFIIAEGSGMMVLEEYEIAKKRNAHIYAEIIGYGASCDAFHITQPEIRGPKLAMENAIADAKIPLSEYSYINAHGTSTYYNDMNESKAIEEIFGNLSSKLMVSSNKSMIGHTLGAAGAIEAAFTALTIERGIVPPTINLEERDPECRLDYVPNTAREIRVNAALSNSFGFGGTNGILAFRKI